MKTIPRGWKSKSSEPVAIKVQALKEGDQHKVRMLTYNLCLEPQRILTSRTKWTLKESQMKLVTKKCESFPS